MLAPTATGPWMVTAHGTRLHWPLSREEPVARCNTMVLDRDRTALLLRRNRVAYEKAWAYRREHWARMTDDEGRVRLGLPLCERCVGRWESATHRVMDGIAASRLEQGFPLMVEDEGTLRKVRALMGWPASPRT